MRPPLAAAAVALAAALGAGCGGNPADREVRAVEDAYRELRDAILEGDDEAFFRMHCREAREGAVRDVPLVRANYASLPAEKREDLLRQFHVTAEEFLGLEPEALVKKVMPWRTGWRERAEIYRKARVKDVRIGTVPRPGGGEERRGVVVLDIASAVEAPGGAPIPEKYLPTIVFVKDPDGWRRRYFLAE